MKNTITVRIEMKKKETIDDLIKNLNLIKEDMEKIHAKLFISSECNFIDFSSTNEEDD